MDDAQGKQSLYLEHEEPMFAEQLEPEHIATLPVVRYPCAGCSYPYRTLEGLLVIALPMKDHPWKRVYDTPACARKRNYTVAATIFELAKAKGESLFVDPNGNPLPQWRISELLGDAPEPADFAVYRRAASVERPEVTSAQAPVAQSPAAVAEAPARPKRTKPPKLTADQQAKGAQLFLIGLGEYATAAAAINAQAS